jgi:hypothetical protein
MGEALTRTLNGRLRSFAPAYPSRFPAKRNALISELGFRIFCAAHSGTLSLSGDDASSSPVTAELAEHTREYISSLENYQYTAATRPEIEGAVMLAQRLSTFFLSKDMGDAILTRPQFKGCGVIDDCEGDVLVGATLCEIKNVGRGFRLADLRQLLTYAALNSADPMYNIDAIGLVNARSGMFYRVKLNILSMAVAGVTSPELLADIVNYISLNQPSR